ncbi:MAG: phosphate signaling complex protein PhoU [Firmicutes bacterium]|nr:phosphate signaling complex protein PhoU [Bacillota bacterium]
MRTRYENQLAQLNEALIEMGKMVEKAIEDAIKAMVDQDVELAKSTIEYDEEVDNMEKEIESLCLKLILQQQPVARDLRLISCALKMITDLERIGDHAEDISELTILLAGEAYVKELEHIPQMAEEACKMVNQSVEAFVKMDLELARAVMKYDDKVDDLFDSVRNELVEYIKTNSERSDQAVDLIMIAKYFERIGDHAKNVAEWVEFSLTGSHKDHMII